MNAVLIDFVDTLAERWPRRESLLAEVLADAAGLSPSRRRMRAVYRMLDEVWPYSSVQLRTREDRRSYYQRYNRMLLRLLGASEALAATVHAAFVETPRPWRLKAGAQALLRGLVDAGRPLAVVSNFDSGLETLLFDDLAVSAECIRVVLASQNCGVEKPDPRFFAAALEALSADPAQTTHIGDSWSLDYLPARALGMRALLVDEDGDYAHLPDTIGGLDQAARALGLECC